MNWQLVEAALDTEGVTSTETVVLVAYAAEQSATTPGPSRARAETVMRRAKVRRSQLGEINRRLCELGLLKQVTKGGGSHSAEYRVTLSVVSSAAATAATDRKSATGGPAPLPNRRFTEPSTDGRGNGRGPAAGATTPTPPPVVDVLGRMPERDPDRCRDCGRVHLRGEHVSWEVPTPDGGHRVAWEGCCDCWLRRTDPFKPVGGA